MIYDTPVLTGRVDQKSVDAVFKGWDTSPDLQEQLNPVVEMTRAKHLRDWIVIHFGVRAMDLVGTPKTERHSKAQRQLIDKLIGRGWRKKMIETYFGIMLTGRDWKAMGGAV